MRSAPVKSNKKTMKVASKKVSCRNKKMAGIRSPIRDTISETISFVIKGKLTPIKPIIVQNKVDSITKCSKTPQKCGRVVKKINQVPIKTKIKAIKKLTEEHSQVKTRVQMKTAKKPSAQSSCKRNAEKIPVKVIPRVPKKTAKPVKVAPVIKKKPKAKVEKIKKVKKVKCEKIRKSPVKKPKKQNNIVDNHLASSEKTKEDEIKKQQTIEQLLKEVNEEMKTKNSPRHRCAKNKIKVRNQRQTVESRIEKLPESYETKDVSKKESVDEIACLEKAIKSEMIDSPGELSDEIPLKVLSQLKPSCIPVGSIKTEPVSDREPSSPSTLKKKQYRKLKTKPRVTVIKKRIPFPNDKAAREEQRSKTKLFRFWNGPKRHRVASLNALAKVHCLYENETRGNILDIIDESSKLAYAPKREQGKCRTPKIKKESEDEEATPSPPPTRTLRSVPGLRAVGKHWDMHDTSSSSEDEDNTSFEVYPVKTVKKEKTLKAKREIAKVVPETPKEKPRRKAELVMDLKDMVVCKRMASLNASAILAASYSPEKRTSKTLRDFDDSSSYASASSDEYFAASDNEIKEEDGKNEDGDKVLEVNNPKVAVILNQDTDVTITGVYVNSTTRSTHHEGYCSIAGMQYRISATSHTQTAATAVATETLLQSSSSSAPDNSNSDSMPSSKSYTPLDALSNMQPPPGPGIQHNHPVVHGQQHMGPPQHVLPMPAHQMSPGLRHSCSSAFSSPHSTPNYQIPPGHHPPTQGEPGYIHAGYYQPAGPLITVPHGHGQPPPPPPLTKTAAAPLSEASPTTSTTPSVTAHEPPPPPPSSNGDSSDSEVIITSVTTAKDSIPPPNHPPSAYRYPQYPTAPPGYSYSYPPPYHYPNPPPPNPSYAHHDLCYSPNPYVHKYSPYRSRYVTSTQYYPPPNPPEMYGMPPGGPSQQSQQVVTSTPVSASASVYPPAPGGPPPPTLMETYPAPQPPLVETYQPPPPHYYPTAYGPAPSCYTHSPSRAIPYINATYQSCPCPMQSCPKNVLTGPLTGDSKRSNISSISKDSMPLPPVALALPFEPTSATGPPSPARGSAGMPPPPSASPAGATYQPPPPPTKQESHNPAVLEDYKIEKKRKARIGKAMVRNNIAANMHNTMLLMCNTPQNYVGAVKREIESPKEKELVEQKKEICTSDEETKPVTENISLPCAKIEELEKAEPQLVAPIEPKEEKICEDSGNSEKNYSAVKEVVEEILQPVVSTVAENVKVKNMKRTLSISKEKAPDPEVAPSSKKKQKLGSYKCLIKRDSNAVRIHNGRRRLIEEAASGSVQTRTKIKIDNITPKRKLSETKEATIKRSRLSKPFAVSNFIPKSKDKLRCEETKEFSRSKLIKKPKVNSKVGTKSAPAVLDHLFAKNNVERIIESVVSEGCVRTTQESGAVKTSERCAKTAEKCVKTAEKCAKTAEKCVKTAKETAVNKKSTNNRIVSNKVKSEVKIMGASRRKSKCKEETIPQAITKIPRRSFQFPRWSNGWIWEGESFEAKVFINSDETIQIRRCYPAMRHKEGDKIVPRDCVLLKAGPRKNDLPFVAKIASLWENPEDGEMMMSLLWYYRPEHTEQGRLPADQPDEVFASRHKDSNSVACIDDKCYVLTFNEYCRYRKRYRRIEEGIEEPLPCIPNPEPYPRTHRQPPPSQISPDMVFFCRRVYDFRQKRIMKNPT